MAVESLSFEQLMDLALAEARSAFNEGEVPVGAVVTCGGEIIARAHNRVEAEQDASSHAEMLAMREAAKQLGGWRLSDCILCCTLEPCAMCAGALRLARIPMLVYGAADPRMGAVGSRYDLSSDPDIGPLPAVISGIKAQECQALLKDFFVMRREERKAARAPEASFCASMPSIPML